MNGKKRSRGRLWQDLKILLMLVLIAAAGIGITLLRGGRAAGQADGLHIVTTVRPLYAAALQLTDGVPDVRVENLTGSSTGCLHDYQLSPANRLSLARADLVVLNGAGAEGFLDEVLPQLDASVTDTSAGIELLSGHEHDHEHEEDHDHDHEEDHDHEHEDDHDHAVNEHIWVSPTRYAAQVRTLSAALQAADPAHAAQYAQNAARYLAQIQTTEERMQTLRQRLQGRRCVLFHDSLAYLADELSLQVAAVLPVGEDSGVSAGELAEAERIAREDPTVLLIYDDQYTTRFGSVDRQVPADRVLALDTAVKGEGRADDWLQAMERTLSRLENIGEG